MTIAIKVIRKILDKIKSELPFSSNKPMERWNSDKLSDIKTYLENKDPHSWSREDHYLAIEFVIQRYLPADENRTQAQHDAILRKLQAKVDKNIDQPEYPKEEFKEDPEFNAFLNLNPCS